MKARAARHSQGLGRHIFADPLGDQPAPPGLFGSHGARSPSAETIDDQIALAGEELHQEQRERQRHQGAVNWQALHPGLGAHLVDLVGLVGKGQDGAGDATRRDVGG